MKVLLAKIAWRTTQFSTWQLFCHVLCRSLRSLKHKTRQSATQTRVAG